jgi:hypothetical protein
VKRLNKKFRILPAWLRVQQSGEHRENQSRENYPENIQGYGHPAKPADC